MPSRKGHDAACKLILSVGHCQRWCCGAKVHGSDVRELVPESEKSEDAAAVREHAVQGAALALLRGGAQAGVIFKIDFNHDQ